MPPPAVPPAAVSGPTAVTPPPPEPVSPPPTVANPDEGPARPQPEARRSSLGVALGLGPVAGQVSNPTFDIGGAAFLRVGPRWDQDEAIPWSLGLSATHLRNDWLGASPAVAISWTAVGLTACPGWGLDLHVVVEVCGTTAVGRLEATAREVSVSTPVTRSWWSAGPVLRARLSLGWGLTVLVDATAHVPLYRRTFVTSTPDETVARTPTVAGTLGVVLAREL